MGRYASTYVTSVVGSFLAKGPSEITNVRRQKGSVGGSVLEGAHFLFVFQIFIWPNNGWIRIQCLTRL